MEQKTGLRPGFDNHEFGLQMSKQARWLTDFHGRQGRWAGGW